MTCGECHFGRRDICLILRVAKSKDSQACDVFLPQYVAPEAEAEAEAEAENKSNFGG